MSLCTCPQCLRVMPKEFPQKLREIRLWPNGRIGCYNCYDDCDDPANITDQFYGTRPTFETLPIV